MGCFIWCAKIFIRASGLISVEDARLEAQARIYGADEDYLHGLSYMWKLRGI